MPNPLCPCPETADVPVTVVLPSSGSCTVVAPLNFHFTRKRACRRGTGRVGEEGSGGGLNRDDDGGHELSALLREGVGESAVLTLVQLMDLHRGEEGGGFAETERIGESHF